MEKQPNINNEENNEKLYEKHKKSANKKVLITVIAVVIIGVLGAGFYYCLSTTHTKPQLLTVITEEIPESIIPINQDKKIIIDETSKSHFVYKELWNLLLDGEYLDKTYNNGDFTRLLFFTRTLDASTSTQYLRPSGLADIFYRKLETNMPKKLFGDLDELTYGPGELDDDLFTIFIHTENGNNRLGLAAKIKSGRDVSKLVRDWEADSMINDLSELLFLMNISTNLPDTKLFNDSQYRDTDIRYINFDGPSNSINYAILKSLNYLIITTSRESMHAIIDNLLQ